jgi:hypothetical protein
MIETQRIYELARLALDFWRQLISLRRENDSLNDRLTSALEAWNVANNSRRLEAADANYWVRHANKLDDRIDQLELDNIKLQDEINALRIAVDDYLRAAASILGKVA